MLPIAPSVVNINPIQTPLINTVLPGSDAVRVPYDSVAPSVSNAEIKNNTNGNGNTATGSGANVSANAESFATFPNFINPQNLQSSAQSTFLTQLLAQESASPQAQIILVQYEKLVALATVKYKPSNALKPSVEPAGVFGKLLKQQPQDNSVDVADAAPVERLPEPTAPNTNFVEQAPVQATPQAVSVPEQVSAAYAEAAARPGIASGTVVELI